MATTACRARSSVSLPFALCVWRSKTENGERRQASRAGLACTTRPADLLPDLQRRVVHHLDASSLLALFRTCRGMARAVLAHTPAAHLFKLLGSAHSSSAAWARTSTALAALLGEAPGQLHLHLVGGEQAHPLLLLAPHPPSSIAHHVAHLHLHRLTLSLPALEHAWRPHDAALWPRLRHLALHDCSAAAPTTAQRPPPSSDPARAAAAAPQRGLRSLTVIIAGAAPPDEGQQAPGLCFGFLDALLEGPVGQGLEELRVKGLSRSWQVRGPGVGAFLGGDGARGR